MAFRTNKTPVLQEKSASGSVATFNTALAMPLKSCNIALTATQSGSGTPSPDNVRTINGNSAIGISATGKNLVDFTARTVTAQSRIIDNLHLNKGDYRFTISVVNNSNINGVFAIRIGTTNIKTVGFNGNFEGIVSTTFNLTENSVINIVLGGGSAGYSFDISNAQIEIGTASTPYTPYNGSFTTITIGSTVYGGEYDARTGVLTVTHKLRIFNGSEDWLKDGENTGRYLIPDWVALRSIPYSSDHYQNIYITANTWDEFKSSINACFFGNSLICKVDTSLYPTVADFKNFLHQNNLQLLYPLPTPEVINLGGMEIDTLQGVNNIWADTGDIDLTYKDLDIAKRGNFREVFKLPS